MTILDQHVQLSISTNEDLENRLRATSHFLTFPVADFIMMTTSAFLILEMHRKLRQGLVDPDGEAHPYREGEHLSTLH